MVLDSKYIAEVNAKIVGVQKGWTDNFRFEFDGFNDPPLRDINDILDEAAATGGQIPTAMKERLLRKMVQGKLIKVRYLEKELGSFTLNDDMTVVPPREVPFESFPVLREHPSAYRQLLSLAISTVLEKSLPPQIVSSPTPSPAAGAARQRRPSDGSGS